ncbi:MAG TPA: transcriptional regulator [Ilumatobacteraceae bacterium]|nr:transcriptional regulator [Ilumatobacteraceae bacterium]
MDQQSTRGDHLSAVSALGEPNRRILYDYVVAAGVWVGRDEAADATGLQRGVSAHHLDRLADDGLLEVEYQRLTGRTGPGAGRPAKVYRRTRSDFNVSLPPRDYEFVGRLLADAIADVQANGGDVAVAVASVAADAGRQLARVMTARISGGKSGDAFSTVLDVLREHGFEPHERDDGTVLLRNCPFRLVAQRHTDLICGMNYAMISAAVGELGDVGLDAVLAPDAEACCVRLVRR